MFSYSFNFTKKQLQEFIYDLRMDATVHYIDVMTRLASATETVACCVSPSNINKLVDDIRMNPNKTVDEFIRDYDESQQISQNTIQSIQYASISLAF